jgi:hypothetical protein
VLRAADKAPLIASMLLSLPTRRFFDGDFRTAQLSKHGRRGPNKYA